MNYMSLNWSPVEPAKASTWCSSHNRITTYLMIYSSIKSGDSFDLTPGENCFTYKITNFRSTDMLFWETDEKDPGYFNDASSSPSEGFSKRHNGGAIVGLMGGHVNFLKWPKYYQILADPGKNELWCFPGSLNGR